MCNDALSTKRNIISTEKFVIILIWQISFKTMQYHIIVLRDWRKQWKTICVPVFPPDSNQELTEQERRLPVITQKNKINTGNGMDKINVYLVHNHHHVKACWAVEVKFLYFPRFPLTRKPRGSQNPPGNGKKTSRFLPKTATQFLQLV
jgi:hypothetical protein